MTASTLADGLDTLPIEVDPVDVFLPTEDAIRAAALFIRLDWTEDECIRRRRGILGGPRGRRFGDAG
jgi:hypothetical protein